MALSVELGKVTLDKTSAGLAVSRIHLSTHAEVPEISTDEFQRIAESAKSNCPVSKALAGARIELDATLEG